MELPPLETRLSCRRWSCHRRSCAGVAPKPLPLEPKLLELELTPPPEQTPLPELCRRC